MLLTSPQHLLITFILRHNRDLTSKHANRVHLRVVTLPTEGANLGESRQEVRSERFLHDTPAWGTWLSKRRLADTPSYYSCAIQRQTWTVGKCLSSSGLR